MNAKQMRWSASHDWYLNAGLEDNGSYTIYVRCDMVEGKELAFTDFDKLTSWAGY